MENNLMAFIQNKYIYIPFLLWFGIQTFKVIYSNGEKLDDWISQEEHDEIVKVRKLTKWGDKYGK